MDVMNCAQIVYAETRNWLPDPSDATGVASARRALARSVLASGDGRGFGPGQVPADLADLIWIDCVKAAQEAEAAPEAPSAIWAAETDPAADAQTAEAHPWLKTAGTPKESGPFLVPGATAPRKLFAYPEVEPNLAGRYPRTNSDVPMPAPGPCPGADPCAGACAATAGPAVRAVAAGAFPFLHHRSAGNRLLELCRGRLAHPGNA